MNEHSSNEDNIYQEILSLRQEIGNLQKVIYTVRGTAIAGALLLTGYLGYTQLNQLPNAIKEIVPKAVEEQVDKQLPQAVETRVSQVVDGQVQQAIERHVGDYISERADTLNQLEAIQSQVLASQQKAVDGAAEIEAILQRTQLVQNSRRAYRDCEWVTVGYDKSHEKVGDWCEAGSYITQLDLAGGERIPGSWPIVEQAKCCRP